MPEIEVSVKTEEIQTFNIDVYCNICGKDLYKYTTVVDKSFHIECCPFCLSRKDDEIKDLQKKLDRANDEIDYLNKELII